MDMLPESSPHSWAFSEARAVARYTEGPPRIVPGFFDMHRMAAILLSEYVPEEGNVLVIGAGGGLELKSLAQAHPRWRFEGVDPSPEMIGLAKQTLGSLASQVRFHEGKVDSAPVGPFDAATCLLTMHFLTSRERLQTALEIRQRLKPGAPFVLVHLSIPGEERDLAVWLSRYAAFAVSSGVAMEDAQTARAAIEAHLKILTPEHDEAILAEAGFSNLNLFYTGLAFRGWVAHA